jgi:hypothetical protein
MRTPVPPGLWWWNRNGQLRTASLQVARQIRTANGRGLFAVLQLRSEPMRYSDRTWSNGSVTLELTPHLPL